MYENIVAWLRDTDFEPICPCADETICEGKDCVVLQAADAIEELQGRAKVLEKIADKWCDAVPKWIPVTERLPEETGPYLVWMLWPHDETHVHSIINFDADCEAFGEWEEYYDPVSLGWAGSDFIKIENVYAWMPLPEPPEGGADG